MNMAAFSSADRNKRPLAPLLVFDIETVPDIPLLVESYEPLLEDPCEKSELWKDLRVLEALKLQKNISFPSSIYHTVVSICAAYVHPETYYLFDGFKRTVPFPGSYEELLKGESQLLKDFWAFSMKYKDHATVWYDSIQSDYKINDYTRRKLKPIPVSFCGYNITGFDLPVIEQRSMKHFLTCPVPDYATDVGVESYRYKFATDKVFDLCHFISNHQPQCRAGLDVIARSMGLGGKMSGMDGSRVAEEYFAHQNWKQIEEYCAVDVLITYGVLLAVQKFRGILDEAQFKDCLNHFEKFLTLEGKPQSYKELAEKSTAFFAYGK